MPPGFPAAWDDLDVQQKALLLAYEQGREYEEVQLAAMRMKL